MGALGTWAESQKGADGTGLQSPRVYSLGKSLLLLWPGAVQLVVIFDPTEH